MKSDLRPIRTLKCIAHELGVSSATVRRMVAKGRLPVTKGGVGGRTSPMLLDRRHLENLKKKG